MRFCGSLRIISVSNTEIGMKSVFDPLNSARPHKQMKENCMSATDFPNDWKMHYIEKENRNTKTET